MRKIRYAIIGFGGIAEHRIAKEGFGCDRDRFDGHPQAELVGATDTNAARRDAASALGLRWYDSADTLLADPDIEAVFIATNNLSHAPLGARAIEAGKHCLIEKPIATTIADAQRLPRIKCVYEPDPTSADVYDAAFDDFRMAYSRLAPLFRRMHRRRPASN